MCSFKGRDVFNNKLKGYSKSQTKHIKFEEDKRCFYGGEYQRECNN